MNRKQTAFSDSALYRTTLGATMISFSAVWVKLANVTPAVSAFYRVCFGALFLLGVLALRTAPLWQGWHCLGLSLLAALFFALDLYAWHVSIGYVGPGLATILSNFQVFMVPLAVWLLYRERVSFRLFFCIPPAVAGLFMIVGVDWDRLPHDYQTGIWYGLATAVFYTGYLVVLRRLQSHASNPSVVLSLLVVSLLTAVYLAVNVVVRGESFAIPDLQTSASLVALGLFSQTLGWLLIAHSLPRIPAAIAGLLLLLQPSLSFVWDVLFFDRPTPVTAWAGVCLTLGAIYIGSTSKRA